MRLILPNKKGEQSLDYYVCSTDYLEQITNIDFFPVLEDNLEEKLESEIHKEFWTGMLSSEYYHHD